MNIFILIYPFKYNIFLEKKKKKINYLKKIIYIMQIKKLLYNLLKKNILIIVIII